MINQAFHIYSRLISYANEISRITKSDSVYIWSDDARRELKWIVAELNRNLGFLNEVPKTHPEINTQGCHELTEQAIKIISGIDQYQTADIALSTIEDSIHKVISCLSDIQQEIARIQNSNISISALYSVENCLNVRRIVNQTGLNLVLYYPGAADDIIHPLECTDAQTFIFTDLNGPGEMNPTETIAEISKKLSGIGTHAFLERRNEHASIIKFETHRKVRHIIYYFYKDARKFIPLELYGGYDVYFSRGSGPFNNPKNFGNILELLRVGGFFVGQGGGDIIESDPNFPDKSLNFAYSKFGFEVVSHHPFLIAKKIKSIKNLPSKMAGPFLRYYIAKVEKIISYYEEKSLKGIPFQSSTQLKTLIEHLRETMELANPILRTYYRMKISNINKRVKQLKK